MNLAILISGGGTNLQSFIDAHLAEELQANIALVVSNRPGAFGLSRASEAGIATAVVDHKAYDSRESFDRALVAALAPHNIELVILAGFMRILTAEFISPYRGRLLNIHPSLLPKYTGLKTHERALQAGDSEAGATVHFVTEQLDAGPAILQARVPIAPGDTEETLAARVLQVEHQIFPLAAQWFASGRLSLRGNEVLLDGELLPATGADFASELP
jgi:phosphoribosylglycinamide formyltransferase-1